MINIFKEVRSLRKELDSLKSDMTNQNNEILELCKRVDSRAYNEMVDKYKAKEKRFYKKAVEIILSDEEPEITYESGFPSCRTIKYKNLYFYQTFKDLIVTYKNFTFNEENSKMLYNLFKSLNCLR